MSSTANRSTSCPNCGAGLMTDYRGMIQRACECKKCGLRFCYECAGTNNAGGRACPKCGDLGVINDFVYL